jgi:hypothetical protein
VWQKIYQKIAVTDSCLDACLGTGLGAHRVVFLYLVALLALPLFFRFVVLVT